MNDTTMPDQPFFRALLTPHRSLGITGFKLIMAAMIFAWAVTGVFMLAHGAWPVFGFFGLDVLGLYVAFRLNYRAARAREEVTLSRVSLDIRKIAPSGRASEHRFNPFWTRFSVRRHEEIGVTDMRLVSREASLPIGMFLNPKDRESFASEFGRAFATAKGR